MNTPTQAPELDRLLRTFFQTEMPHSFPGAPVPVSRNVWRLGPTDQTVWSRVALAASVVLLLIGQLWLAKLGSQREPPASAIGDNATLEAKQPKPGGQP
jgi:hypothetical protein